MFSSFNYVAPSSQRLSAGGMRSFMPNARRANRMIPQAATASTTAPRCRTLKPCCGYFVSLAMRKDEHWWKIDYSINSPHCHQEPTYPRSLFIVSQRVQFAFSPDSSEAFRLPLLHQSRRSSSYYYGTLSDRRYCRGQTAYTR
jgi:hypothetical protein